MSILLDVMTGLGMLSLLLFFQRHVDNFITHGVQAIGQRSLYIFCIHTVELTAIPWYLMAQKFAGREALGLVTHFAVSMGSILLICELLLPPPRLEAPAHRCPECGRPTCGPGTAAFMRP